MVSTSIQSVIKIDNICMYSFSCRRIVIYVAEIRLNLTYYCKNIKSFNMGKVDSVCFTTVLV